MYTLQKLNVVKIVDAKEKVEYLLLQGFTLVDDSEEQIIDSESNKANKEEVVTKTRRGGSKSSS